MFLLARLLRLSCRLPPAGLTPSPLAVWVCDLPPSTDEGIKAQKGAAGSPGSWRDRVGKPVEISSPEF